VANRTQLALGMRLASAFLFAAICSLLTSATFGAAFAGDGQPFASMYIDPEPFLQAIAKESWQRQPLRVTGISVPHHLLAADLIARGFAAAATNRYRRIIIVSPDHFSRSRRPMATTRRDIDTVFGPVENDHAVSSALLAAGDLFDDSDLFAKEHGIAALLPFVRRFFPTAKIVPIAISYGATREQCDRAIAMLEQWIGPDTLIVQSTDYSHYLPVDVARQRDQETLNIIAANDAAAVFRLLQPDHLDSRASQYLQTQLQNRFYHSSATVIANRNSTEYSGPADRTTSYIVTVYAAGPPGGGALSYSDQKVLYFGGDTFLGRWFTAPLADKAVAATVLRRIKNITGGAPMVVNVEGVIMNEPPPGLGPDLHVMYASLAVPLLKAMNVKAAGLANNHSFDLGRPGYMESRSVLEKAGIVPIGNGEVADLGAFRLLALNFIGKFDYRDYPVVKDSDLDAMCRMPARPPLFAFVHWGVEYNNTPGAAQYKAAEALQECGVPAIIGAHPHQASARVEAVRGGEYALAYSLGNLLFDQTAERSSGALLELRSFKQGTFAMRLIPIPDLFELGSEQLRATSGHAVALPSTRF
jgi:AmmeMemoRadiSam system protein B